MYLTNIHSAEHVVETFFSLFVLYVYKSPRAFLHSALFCGEKDR